MEDNKLILENLEKVRLENESAEKERLENERVEKERLEKERLEKERLEKERLENERLENERLEKERIEKERLEKERLENERLEKERLENERLEKERLLKEDFTKLENLKESKFTESKQYIKKRDSLFKQKLKIQEKLNILNKNLKIYEDNLPSKISQISFPFYNPSTPTILKDGLPLSHFIGEVPKDFIDPKPVIVSCDKSWDSRGYLTLYTFEVNGVEISWDYINGYVDVSSVYKAAGTDIGFLDTLTRTNKAVNSFTIRRGDHIWIFMKIAVAIARNLQSFYPILYPLFGPELFGEQYAGSIEANRSFYF
ncbi:unnamed protein product [[Candida] boidinii]|nr:unnamed protein product [[Candida] boidinii]